MKANTDLKIFLVDDDVFSLTIYRQHLRNLGYKHIAVFENGLDCLNSLAQQPDIIFLDHQMDQLNGVEVLKKIKQFNPDIYVVFISGQSDVQTVINSLKLGAFDYIVKDNNDTGKMEEVLNKINEVKELLLMNEKSVVF